MTEANLVTRRETKERRVARTTVTPMAIAANRLTRPKKSG